MSERNHRCRGGFDSVDRIELIEALIQYQESLWNAGASIPVERLLLGQPEVVAGNSELVLELVYNEMILRQKNGETPNPSEYEVRFPRIINELRVQWDVDKLMLRNSHEVTNDSVEEFTHRRDVKGPPGYEILDVLGRGGMGIVYRARQVGLERVVALKMILAQQYAAAEEVARFRTEAGAVARLRHPNIVQIFDIGEHVGLLYFSIEYCEGRSLDQWLAGVPIAPHHAAALIESLARALQHVHDQGIVHRDLKPANILVTQEYPATPAAERASCLQPHALKITDFGLARRIDTPGQTQTGALIGTPSYMAPEQAAGSTTTLGPPVDVYALGAVLYELLTGRPPFRSTALETLEMVRNSDPVRPKQLNSHLPADLETICLKCLEKEPSKRYASALHLADDLRRYQANEPIAARPAGVWERNWRWCRRNPRVAFMTGSIALLLLMIVIGSIIAASVWKKESEAARHAENEAVNAERLRRQELYRAYLTDARASRKTGQIGQRENSLDAVRKILATIPAEDLTGAQWAELRDETIASLALVDVIERTLVPARSPVFFDMDIDGALEMFVAQGERTLSIFTHRDGETHEHPVPSLGQRHYERPIRRLSPDKRWLVEVIVAPHWRPEHRLRVLNCQTQQWVTDVPAPSILFWAPAIHPKEAAVLLPGADGILRIFDLPQCREVRRSPARFPGARVAFSPDGKQAAVASLNGTPEIINTENWETVALIPEALNATAVAWCENGEYVVFGCGDGSIYLYSPRLGRGQLLGHRHAMAVEDVVISADGEYLASVGLDNVTFFRKVRGDRLLFALPGRALRLARDGRRIAMVDDRGVSIREVVGDDAYKFEPLPVDGVEFSPDGRWLALGGPQGVRIVSAYDLKESAYLDLDPCGPPSFRPDGRELTTFGLFTHTYRWPLTPNSTESQVWAIGPAVRAKMALELQPPARSFSIRPQRRGRHSAWSQDGRFLAVSDYRDDRVFLADMKNNMELREFSTLANASQVAVNRNGDWIAGAGCIYLRAKVWNRVDGRSVLDLPDHGFVAFSPDDCWFASSSPDAVQLYRVGSWELGQRFAREEMREPYDAAVPVAFQPGGPLIAFSVRRGVVRVCHRESGAIVANLFDPENRLCRWLSFSPDGSRLAFANAEWGVGIWDLHGLNKELTRIGLNGNGLPSLPAESSPLGGRLTVVRGSELPSSEQWSKNWLALAEQEALRGDGPDAVRAATSGLRQLRLGATAREQAELLTARGRYHLLSKNPSAARDDFQSALALVPQQREAARCLARCELLGSPTMRSPHHAIALLAPFANQKHPDPELQALFALALIRQDRCAEAITVLDQTEGDDPKPLLDIVRAHVNHKAGRTDVAKNALVRAKMFFESPPANSADPLRDELAPLYAEVSRLILSKQ